MNKVSQSLLDRSQCGEIAAECACFNFRKASRAVTQMYDTILAPSGMRSTQFTVLIGLALKDKITVTELADMLAIDRTTLTRGFKPLLKKGYIGFVSDADRRVRAMRLLSKGRKALTQALPLWKLAQRKVTAKFGGRRWSDLKRHLDDAVSLTKD